MGCLPAHFAPLLQRLGLLLAVLFIAGRTAAASEEVTLAVTGDIFTPDAQIVAQAILDHPSVAAVLVTGDTCNGKRAPLQSYQALYQGSLRRLVPRMFPCPGNHDARSQPPFSGYNAFWGPAARPPKRYYSFELGGWHIVSLDSVTFAKGGAAAAAQLQWLKADLARRPNRPTLAYWHYPLFSRAKHDGDPRMKPFWDALYANGPALVFHGHNHAYERFAPMTPDGNPAPETKGIRAFVISPGGATPVRKESTRGKGPRAEIFHGGTQHVGFFMLRPNGAFRFTIQAITRTGMRQTVDQGGGNLLGNREAE